MMSPKKTIAVSACLLGHKVRYDGGHQSNAVMLNVLPELFNIIPVCPEIEIGLGVPRAKIELHQQGDLIKLLSTTRPITDLTDVMIRYAQLFMKQNTLAGLVLKDKSPSCGIDNCKIWDEQGNMRRDASGLFAKTIMHLKPSLPILQSHVAMVECELRAFIQRVNAYAD